MEYKIKHINELNSIKNNKYSLILDPQININLNEIKKNINLFGKEYLENIYYINDIELLNNKLFKNIYSYPSIFCFTKDKEEPDFYLPGLLS